MPKWVIHVSYTGESLEGLLREGATERREATEQLIESLGGTIEAFHYAIGEDDLFVSADLPDNVTANAISVAINASGATRVKSIVPLTPEGLDQVTKKTIVYHTVAK